MVLTQTQIDGLQTQYTAMMTAAKANFVTAIAAAASPNDVVVAVKAVEDELDALDYLNDVINREQELVDASGNTDDDSNNSDDSTPSEVTNVPPVVEQTSAGAESTTTPPQTSTQAEPTPPPAQDIINQATAVVQNNPALLQDIVNTVNSVTQNPELLTKVATALTSSNGDQNIITQGIAEVKNLLAAIPK